MNMGKKCTNVSGVTGVRQEKTIGSPKWTANITYNYKPRWLGSYDTFDDAVKARLHDPDTKTIRLNYYSPTDNKNHFIEYSLEGEVLQCY